MIRKKTEVLKPPESPIAAPPLLPICCFVTIFRAAVPDIANTVPRDELRFHHEDVGFIAFAYDKFTLRETKHPLCFHALVYCLPGEQNPGGTTLFKTGGGGSHAKPYQQDYAALISELLRSIRDFPCGWTEDVPLYVSNSPTENDDHASKKSA